MNKSNLVKNTLIQIIGALKNTDEVYSYDAAGNVIGNADRDIVTIHYDSRNLAHLIATETGFHRYSYDEEGLRTAKYYRPDTQSGWTLRTYYARGAFGEILAQYDGTQLQYWNILAAAGETLGRMDEADETRYYYLKDHTSTTPEGRLSTGLGSCDY